MREQWELDNWRAEAADERAYEERAGTMDSQTGEYGVGMDEELEGDE